MRIPREQMCIVTKFMQLKIYSKQQAEYQVKGILSNTNIL